MTQVRWIALTLVFAAASLGLLGGPIWQERARYEVLEPIYTEGNTGTLAGVDVRISGQSALIMREVPDRQVIHLELTLSPDTAEPASWKSCELALTDGERRWLPVMGSRGAQILEFMGFPRTLVCAQSLFRKEANGTSVSHQVFIVPSDAGSGLRMEISGLATHPAGLSMPVTPVPRLQ